MAPATPATTAVDAPESAEAKSRGEKAKQANAEAEVLLKALAKERASTIEKVPTPGVDADNTQGTEVAAVAAPSSTATASSVVASVEEATEADVKAEEGVAEAPRPANDKISDVD